MIAEIKGKVKCEDELTGSFFGNLRYIPFDKGLKKILRNAIRPIELQSLVDEIDAYYWNDNISFWDKVRVGGKITEFDVLMDFSTVTIGIEVKYQSGLSSDDGKDIADVSAENSKNQLSREARALRLVGTGKSKLLLLLADDLECAKIIPRTKVPDGVRLGYLSWQEVLLQLRRLTGLNDFEQLVAADLVELLEKKGFSGFSGFGMDAPVISNKDYWHFEAPKIKYQFSFENDKTVEKKYYEFG